MTTLKNVFILGDSYSTYEGHIPTGYDSYYGDEIENGTGVNRVEQTWWYQLISATASSLVVNHSWSGTTICNTGYDGPDTPNSFIRRFDRLIEGDFFQNHPVDTFIVFGGQNDDWCNAPIGKLQTENWSQEDLRQYCPALCYLMYRLKNELPQARLIFVINSEMKPEVMTYQRQACGLYGIEAIELRTIHKIGGHPTRTGMQQICQQILEHLSWRKNL